MAKYHGKNLRKGRYSEPGRPYLVTAVTHARRPVFRDWQMARALVAELRRVTDDDQRVDTLAWVIMPDHFHWLVVLRKGALEEVVVRVKSRSAIAINRLLGSHGRLWQPGFHDHALRHEEDIQHVARYLIANPLRAGLVKRLGDYPLWDAVWI